jgi:hypothetical protein
VQPSNLLPHAHCETVAAPPTGVIHEVCDGILPREPGASAAIPPSGTAIGSRPLRGCVSHQVTPPGGIPSTAALESVVQTKPVPHLGGCVGEGGGGAIQAGQWRNVSGVHQRVC